MYFFLVSKGLNTSYNYAYIFDSSFHNGGSPKMGIVEKIRAILSEKIAIMTRYVNFHAIYFCKIVSRDKICKKNKNLHN